ncbi:MAG: patatin-like phospholipase family protein [Actinomycetota bacterium]
MATEKMADLVLEGGGVKGIALVGAYAALQQAGYRFNCVAGTSAGAIVGALIAAGMPAADLQKLMKRIDYVKFEDEGFIDHLGLVGKGLSILFEKGIYEGDYLRNWLDHVLAGLGHRTFGDMRLDDPGTSLGARKRYRLVVMTSDVSRGELVRLPWDYPKYGLDPDEQLVADTVRASMSIPFFYEPVRLVPKSKTEPSLLVDGGMLSNFPIEVFDRTDGKPPRWPTFGIKLSARPGAVETPKFKTSSTFDFAKAMIGTMMSFHDQMHIEDPSVIARTMFVDTFGVSATDFHLSRASQDKLFASGRDAAVDFLKGWSFSRYVRKFRAG